MNDWLSQIANNQEFISTLVVGVCCGFLVIFIDIDHPIAYWIKGKPSRFLHLPVTIIACLVIIGVIAYVRGFCL